MSTKSTAEKETIDVTPTKPAETLPAQAPSFSSHVEIKRRGVEITTLEDLHKFSQWIIKANMNPPTAKTAEAVCLIIQFGFELGLSPMSALQNIYIVNNRPALYGEIGIALARSTGQLEHFKEYTTGEFPNDDFTAVCEIRRKGDSVTTVKEFSVSDAKIAGIWMQNVFKTYPKDLLQWKATWRGLRRTFADVLKGIGGYEDLIGVAPQDIEPIKEIEAPKAKEKPAKKKNQEPDNQYPPEKVAAVVEGYKKSREQLEKEFQPDPADFAAVADSINPDPKPEPQPEPKKTTPAKINKDNFCLCGEEFDDREKMFYKDKPHLEKTCFVCTQLKKKGEAYGLERQR